MHAKKWLFLPPLIIGVVLLVILVKNRSEPEQAAVQEIAHPVRVISVPSVNLIPRARAYGSVAPGTSWDAIAEVDGRIVEIHEQLRRGELLAADSVLLRIDPTDYELALAQVAADIQAADAQLAELAVKIENTQASLAIEEDALRLAEQELARKRTLADRGTVTRSDLEREQRTTLAQRQNTQNLRNTLALLPAERQLLQAQRARLQTQQQRAKRDLAHTTIRLPFAGRIAEVNVERDQFVRRGETLASADGLELAEITAQLPLARMRDLISPDTQLQIEIGKLDSQTIRKALDLKAQVHLRSRDLQVSYPARFVRLSDTVDPQTRTLGVIIAVDKPYELAIPGVRPPLIKGMFVEVELLGKARPDTPVIPRYALHGDTVYAVDQEQRLQRREVELGLVQSELASIDSGLQAGETIIVSDPVPAIDAMLLQPMADEDSRNRLIQDAQGEMP